MNKGLKKEFILTLLLHDNIGNSRVLNLVKDIGQIDSIDDLYQLIASQKAEYWKNITLKGLHTTYEIAKEIIRKSEEFGIGVMGYFDDCFPKSLRECMVPGEVGKPPKLSPSILLYYRGNLDALKMPGVAIIGTREPTKEGIQAAEFLGKEFAKQNFNVISGLAIGCDTSAHEGALLGGGVTTAFLANGLDWDSIYPAKNLELAKRIVDTGGLLLSEYSIGESPKRYQLVARDRLQAGLASGTIVVQTGIEGGTMHAVNATLAAGKPLYAVEYSSAEIRSEEKTQGNIHLIETGKARPIGSKNINTVAEALLAEAPPTNHKDCAIQGIIDFKE